MRVSVFCGAVVLILAMLSHSKCVCVEPAPYDFDQECRSSGVADQITTPATGNNTLVLLDTHHYRTLSFLWFADDESIDLFSFPVPTDPDRWAIVDEAECMNVWQYCGNSSADILITQFVSRGNISETELTISIDFNFFDFSQPQTRLSCSQDDQEVIIVEADDTTGLRNLHIQHIECGDPRTTLISGDTSRYDFPYTPSEDFELVLRANISENVCVNISRVRVFHRFCPEFIANFIRYNFTAAGRDTSGACVPNSVPLTNETFAATCEEDTMWTYNPSASCHCDRGFTANHSQCIACPAGTYKAEVGGGLCLECPSNSNSTTEGSAFCACNTGYIRTDPSNVFSSCDGCDTNDYRNAQGMCVPCPLPGAVDTEGAFLDRCRCANGSELSSGISSGSSSSAGPVPCEACAANYFRVQGNSSCLLCPPGSRRELDSENEGTCFCTNNSSTAEGALQTTSEPCNHCASTHFSDGLQCYRCPGNSFSLSPTDTECTCATNTINPAGQLPTTTNIDCVCVSGYYRSPSNRNGEDGPCAPCPMNSDRHLDAIDQTICQCESGYARHPSSNPSLPCLPIVGFNQSSILLPEGNGSSHIVSLRVFISVATTETLTVSLSLSPSSQDLELLTERLVFSGSTLYRDVQLRVFGDQVALEDDQPFNIALMEGVGYIIGGSTGETRYHGNLEVIIEDDDVVIVGFEEKELRIGETVESVNVTVVISSEISRDLVIRVTTTDFFVSTSLENNLLIFEPNGPRSQTITLNIRGELFESRAVIGLEPEDSAIPISEFQNRIHFGDEDQTFGSLTLIVGDVPLSDGAKAGIAFGIAVPLVVLVLAAVVIAIVVGFCYYCRGNTKSCVEARNNDYDQFDMKKMEAESGESGDK